MSADAKCRSCGASVVWLIVDGKPMILDPPERTMVEQIPTENGGKPQGKMVQVRASHFATCPNAAAWRRNPR